MRKAKWCALSLLAGCWLLGVMSCLGPFWQGLTTGWPSNRLLNLAVDVAREVAAGG